MNRLALLVLSFILTFIFVLPLNAQNKKVVKKIIEIGTTDNQTMQHLDILTNRFGGRLIGSDAMYDDFEKICKPLNDINPDFPFTLSKRKPGKKPKQARGTDSGPFAVEGVPTITFGTADSKGYDFSYREIWRTERDMYNMSIPEYQEHTSIVTAIIVYGVANLDHLLSREGYFLPDEEKKL